MRRLLLPCIGLAALVAPAAASAETTSTDQSNAAKDCRTQRGSTADTREAFRMKYGTNKNRKNAFGKCVSTKSRSEESQREDAMNNAAKACKAERTANPTLFATKYGTNKNAYGKCVSRTAKQNKAKADAADAKKIKAIKNAAKTCAGERTSIGRDEFAKKYGTNESKSNAFGKCVSSTAKAKSNA